MSTPMASSNELRTSGRFNVMVATWSSTSKMIASRSTGSSVLSASTFEWYTLYVMPQDPWAGRLGVWWIAEDHPDQPAVVESPSGDTLTFGELAGRAHQLVHALRARGVERGDIV